MDSNKEDVKNLLKLIDSNLEAILKKNLFMYNEDYTRQNIANSLLKNITHFSGIKSYEVKIPTWEDLYPCMSVRLLAIEAEDKFGDYFEGKLPQEAFGYPYQKKEVTIFAKSQLTEEQIECIQENYEIYYEDDIIISTLGNIREDGLIKLIDDVQISFQLLTPYNVMNAYIQPVVPVKYITFKCKITRDNLDFKELIEKES